MGSKDALGYYYSYTVEFPVSDRLICKNCRNEKNIDLSPKVLSTVICGWWRDIFGTYLSCQSGHRSYKRMHGHKWEIYLFFFFQMISAFCFGHIKGKVVYWKATFGTFYGTIYPSKFNLYSVTYRTLTKQEIYYDISKRNYWWQNNTLKNNIFVISAKSSVSNNKNMKN